MKYYAAILEPAASAFNCRAQCQPSMQLASCRQAFAHALASSDGSCRAQLLSKPRRRPRQSAPSAHAVAFTLADIFVPIPGREKESALRGGQKHPPRNSRAGPGSSSGRIGLKERVLPASRALAGMATPPTYIWDNSSAGVFEVTTPSDLRRGRQEE